MSDIQHCSLLWRIFLHNILASVTLVSDVKKCTMHNKNMKFHITPQFTSLTFFYGLEFHAFCDLWLTDNEENVICIISLFSLFDLCIKWLWNWHHHHLILITKTSLHINNRNSWFFFGMQQQQVYREECRNNIKNGKGNLANEWRRNA